MPETDPPSRAIVLCADDYALSEGVDRAILELAAAGRLTALGCLVQSPRWPAAARALASLRADVDIGLHFNLTEALGNAWRRPLPQLLAGSRLRLLPTVRLRASLEAQLDAFTGALQRPPDYVDGHRHVHQLPQIRDVLLDVLERRGWRPWLRVTTPLVAADHSSAFKARVIAALGAHQLAVRCRQTAWPHNPAFTGIYGFNTDVPGYLALLQNWFARMPADTLFMCHPGTDSTRLAVDPIAPARCVEYEALRSADFTRLLTRLKLHPARGRSRYAPPAAPAAETPRVP